MKRTLFLMLAVVLVAGLSGCCGTRGGGLGSRLFDGSCGTCADCPETCQPCDTGSCGSCEQDCGSGQCAPACGCDDCSSVKGGRLRGFISSICPAKYSGGGCIGGGRGQAGHNLMAPIAYPYYSLRGPRDFLAKNPPSIGP